MYTSPIHTKDDIETSSNCWPYQNSIFFPVALIILTGCFYLYTNSNIEQFSNWPTLKYSTNDSTTYLDVGEWLINDKSFVDAKNSIAIRPFLYPLIVVTLEKIHPWAIIVFQYLLWQMQIILVFCCGMFISRSPLKSFLLAGCCASVLSPIGISLHVLTETTVSFIFTLSLFLLLAYTKNKSNNTLLFFYLLLLSLCSVIKPSYYYIFLLNVIFCLFIWKNRSIKGLLVTILIFTPILFQYTIMHKNINLNKLSFIDTLAVNNYFLSALELYKRNLEYNQNGKKMMVLMRDIRREYLEEIIASDEKDGYKNASIQIKMELFRNLMEFPIQSMTVFMDYINANSSQPSAYVVSQTNDKNNLYLAISYWQTNILKYINIISAAFFFLLFIISKTNKQLAMQLPGNYLPVNFAIFSTIAFTYISSGVSGFQGDRFIIPIFFIGLIWFFYQLNAISYIFRLSKNNS